MVIDGSEKKESRIGFNRNGQLETTKSQKGVGNSLKLRRIKLFVNSNLKYFLPIILLVGVLFVLQLTGVTQVSQISVVSNDKSDLQFVNAKNLENELNKKYTGKNFYTLSMLELEKEVKAQSPYIKEAYIRKIFPSFIKVSIVERDPAFVIGNSGNCLLLDSERYSLEINESDWEACASSYLDDNLIKIESLDPLADFELGERAQFYDGENIEMVKKILIQNGYLLNKVKLQDGVYNFELVGDKVLKISAKEEWEVQQKRLIIVLAELQAQGVQFTALDVRYNRPVFLKDE